MTSNQYTQCHFFAGIGVWSYALRRAGWADSRPVGLDHAHASHLAPPEKRWFRRRAPPLARVFGILIRERRPATVLGRLQTERRCLDRPCTS